MKSTVLLAAVITASVALSAQTAKTNSEKPLVLKSSVPLPGIKGDFDHFAADVASNRLFLAAEDHKSVEIYELRSGKHIASVGGFGAPHAIVFNPEKNTILVTDSGEEGASEGAIRVISGKDYKIIDNIKTLAAADSAGYDPDTHLMYADTGGTEAKMDYTVIDVIDINANKSVNKIKVDSGRVEAIKIEKDGSRMFANMRTKGQIGVFDKKDYHLITTWPISGAADNVPMAYDEANHRLFVVCRKPGTFVVFDTESGKQLMSLPTVSRADDMAYDAANKQIYIAGGDGFVDVISQKDSDHYQEVAKVPSGPVGKIGIFVPELKRFYVATSAKGDAPAKILIYDVK